MRRDCSINPDTCECDLTPIYGCGTEGMTLLNSCPSDKEFGLCLGFEF